MTKKALSLFYKTPSGNYDGSLSIVTPVYNESPEVFRLALESWQNNGRPDEIIAVIDYSDEKCIDVFREFSEKNLNAKLIITDIPGKRPALAEGIKRSSSGIVALVDSDIIWSAGVREKIMKPFSDSGVGGVGTRQDVLMPNTLARIFFKIHLDIRYLNEFTFLAATGDSFTCLSGRTAAYRRSAIINLLDKLVNEKFLGKKMISGDDKTLTHLVLAQGWKIKYVKDAKVYTFGAADMATFLKQQLRWNRNSWRADIKAVFSKWVWSRHKILGLYMLDRFLQPFALVLGLVYFVISLLLGHWVIVFIIIVWWFFSRSIKIFPHLRECPEDIVIIPAYIVFTYFLAFVKIYALLTLDEQKWITRWSSGRMISTGFVKTAASFLAMAAIICGLFFTVIQYSGNLFNSEPRVESRKSLNSVGTFFDSGEDFEKKSGDFKAAISRNNGDPHGFYSIRDGDTMWVLRNKFNLTKFPKLEKESGNIDILNVGEKIKIPVSDLGNPIHPSISSRTFPEPNIFYNASDNTIYLKEGGSVATPKKILSALGPENSFFNETSPGEWILRTNLYVGKNVVLVLDGSEMNYLKLKSDDEKYVWIRSEGGNILISNTKITSWNEKTNSPDFVYKDVRSYITAKNSGRMDILNSELAYLGFEGKPKRGGPFGGSYGISWKIKNGSLGENLLTGVVANNRIHDNYFGIYTFGATGMVIKDNEIFNNVNYGIDPHDDSNNFLISGNKVYENGNHGIILSKRCFGNQIINNVSFNNRLHGIMLDRDSNRNVIEQNRIYGNHDGIAVFESRENVILGNVIYENEQGIRLSRFSSGNIMERNSIYANGNALHVYDNSDGNYFLENSLTGNSLAVSIQNSSNNYFKNNHSSNEKEINLEGEAHGNQFQKNQ